MEPSEATISIPGQFTVTYEGTVEEGRITKMAFTPDAGAAGYFGPSAEVWDAKTRDDGLDRLDVEDTDGPFWRAMQAALAETWRFQDEADQDNDAVVTGPWLPIQWEE
jgi:hypothetical protein